MPIRVATAPVSWGVMEVEGWGRQKSYGEVLDEMVQAGYTGTELGPYGFLPTDRDTAKERTGKKKPVRCSARSFRCRCRTPSSTKPRFSRPWK